MSKNKGCIETIAETIMEKVKQFSDSPFMIIMLLQYIKEYKLKRFHQRKAMRKNIDVYYRAIENVINNSKLNLALLQSKDEFSSIIPQEWFSVQSVEPSQNQEACFTIDFSKIQELNHEYFTGQNADDFGDDDEKESDESE